MPIGCLIINSQLMLNVLIEANNYITPLHILDYFEAIIRASLVRDMTDSDKQSGMGIKAFSNINDFPRFEYDAVVHYWYVRCAKNGKINLTVEITGVGRSKIRRQAI